MSRGGGWGGFVRADHWLQRKSRGIDQGMGSNGHDDHPPKKQVGAEQNGKNKVPDPQRREKEGPERTDGG